LKQTNFITGGLLAAGDWGKLAQLSPPPLNLALHLRYNLLLALSVAAE